MTVQQEEAGERRPLGGWVERMCRALDTCLRVRVHLWNAGIRAWPIVSSLAWIHILNEGYPNGLLVIEVMVRVNQEKDPQAANDAHRNESTCA
jgi:hypothetical protein